MKCPDCGKTIGRFKTTTDDEDDHRKEVLRCPSSGRKMLPPGEVSGFVKTGPKENKKRKSQRSSYVKPKKKSKPLATNVIAAGAWGD